MTRTWKEWLIDVWVRWRKWAVCWAMGRPHFVIGEPENPYMLRWYVIPRNDWLCIYVHKFLRDDLDEALHDHPWNSFSILFLGSLVEEKPAGVKTRYKALSFFWRQAADPHRIELIDKRPAWTLFFTGPRIRDWGFHCPKGWVLWTKFVESTGVGNVSKGCPE